MKISSITPESWTSETIQMDRRSKKNKGVIHPIFQELSHYLEDPQAVDQLISASKGKFPAKFSFADNTLLYKKNGKVISSLIPSIDNPLLAAEDVIHFLSSQGEVSVDTSSKEEDDLIVWGKNKKLQEVLLSYFIMEQRETLKLSKREVEQLRQVLQLGMISRSFTKSNIVIREKRIQSIGGLIWNDALREFAIEEKTARSVMSRASAKQKEGNIEQEALTKDAVPHFTLKLNKYLDRLERKMKESEKYQDSPFLGYSINLLQGLSTRGLTESDEDVGEGDTEDLGALEDLEEGEGDFFEGDVE